MKSNYPEAIPGAPSRREWALAFVVALGLTAVLLIPYVLGYAFERPDRVFTGTIMNPEDSQTYFAKMREGYEGNWLYTIPFTPEDHAPAFVGGFYLLLGQLARTLQLSLDAMWHLARVVADLVLFLATFGFISAFMRERRARWIAYLLALGGSGLGWLLFVLNEPYWLDAFPVDFKSAEAHLFFTALTFPHVAIGVVLILASVWCVKQIGAPLESAGVMDNSPIKECGVNGPSANLALGAGVANLALAIAYPFLIYLVAGITALYWLYLAVIARRILWRTGLYYAVAFLIPAPLVVYYAGTLATNPVFRTWDTQSITLSPPLPHYLLAYGVMLILAGLSLRDARRRDYALLWVWITVAALLLYAPINSQRRYVQGLQVPLAILSVVGLCRVVLPWIEATRPFRWLAFRPRYSAAGLERFLVIAFLGFMALSNGYVLISVSLTATLQQPYPLFRSRSEIAAMDWLNTAASPSSVVLSSYDTGNYIAAHTGMRVVLGHWAETLNWNEKMADVALFYDAHTDNAWRRELLTRYRVRYVFVGPREHALGNWDPRQANYLSPVFANDAVEIYAVN